MADDDPLRKIASSLKGRQPVKKVHKVTRSLSLAEPDFTILQNYCKTKGMFTSDMIDILIKAYLETIKDELSAP